MALDPARTFSTRWDGPLWPTLRLGLLWTLLGYVGTTAWSYALRFDEIQERLATAANADVPAHLLPWIPWLGLPMAVLIRFTACAALLHFGMRMSTPTTAGLRDHLRIHALASVMMLLGVLPIVGSSLAVVSQFVVLLAWVQRQHALGLVRSLMALAPWLLAALLFDVVGGV